MEAVTKEIGTVVEELKNDLTNEEIIKYTGKIFKKAFDDKEITKKDLKTLKNLVKGLLK